MRAQNFINNLLRRHNLDSQPPRSPMTEEQATKLANEVNKEEHRRKIEFILLVMLGVIVVVILCLVVNRESKSQTAQWGMTTITGIVGFITGFVSARRNPDTPTASADSSTTQNRLQ